ncbi:MAG TPA: response regulator, partial [Azospirillum sp.]|nr:response regulator [Azospirillum sp.]
DESGVGGEPGSAHPVEVALNTLDESDRRLYLLVNLEDVTLADAADTLGMAPERAVESLNHSREVVRNHLTAVILIVEDDAIIAFDLAETVRGMGHIVCGNATTMDEALTLAAEHTPTLALMDIRLAEGDNGIEVARELRRQRFLPVIFVTAFPDELAKRGLEHLGPVIPKPFTRDQIEQAITRAVFTPVPEEAKVAAPPAT